MKVTSLKYNGILQNMQEKIADICLRSNRNIRPDGTVQYSGLKYNIDIFF
jgi:hypothetical protein